MLQKLDQYLDGVTMYKVVLYGLLSMALWATILGLLGVLPYPGLIYMVSLGLILLVCWGGNYLLARLFHVVSNSESSLITGAILFFVLLPAQNISEGIVLIIAAMIAIVSKYIIVWKRKHIFNPAALSILLLTFLGSTQVSWWVGSLFVLPISLVVGILIVRKIRRFNMVFTFLAVASAVIILFGLFKGYAVMDLFQQLVISWPLVFFATVMLTEPSTTPPTNRLRLFYAGLVGFLFGYPFHFGPLFSTPELALVIGNIYSYIVSSKEKILLHLTKKQKIAKDTYEFVFSPKGSFSFIPGQYMELTVGHEKVDIRGNRRYFTIASSPSENEIKLGIKYNAPGSSFKKALAVLSDKKAVIAGGVAGDFTLPKDKTKPLVFLAGGIGITPFRSMIKYLLDKGEKRDIVLFYSNKIADEIAYNDIFDKGKSIGVKTVYSLTDKEHTSLDWKGNLGRVDAALIQKEVPDYKNARYYISGPHPMVVAYKAVLKSMGISSSQIVVDYFPGFV